jgi:hypothetical protein
MVTNSAAPAIMMGSAPLPVGVAIVVYALPFASTYENSRSRSRVHTRQLLQTFLGVLPRVGSHSAHAPSASRMPIDLKSLREKLWAALFRWMHTMQDDPLENGLSRAQDIVPFRDFPVQLVWRFTHAARAKRPEWALETSLPGESCREGRSLRWPKRPSLFASLAGPAS